MFNFFRRTKVRDDGTNRQKSVHGGQGAQGAPGVDGGSRGVDKDIGVAGYACAVSPTHHDGNKPDKRILSDATPRITRESGNLQHTPTNPTESPQPHPITSNKQQEDKKETRSAVSGLIDIMAKGKGKKNHNKNAGNKQQNYTQNNKQKEPVKLNNVTSEVEQGMQPSKSVESMSSMSSSFCSAPCTPVLPASHSHVQMNHQDNNDNNISNHTVAASLKIHVDIPEKLSEIVKENPVMKDVKPTSPNNEMHPDADEKKEGSLNSADFVKIMVLQKYNKTLAPIYNKPVTSVAGFDSLSSEASSSSDTSISDLTSQSDLKSNDQSSEPSSEPISDPISEPISDQLCESISEPKIESVNETITENLKNIIETNNQIACDKKIEINGSLVEINCEKVNDLERNTISIEQCAKDNKEDIHNDRLIALHEKKSGFHISEHVEDSVGLPDVVESIIPSAEPDHAKENIHNNEKRDLVKQESRFTAQLEEANAQTSKTEAQANELRYKMEELHREILIKSSAVDRLQAELTAAYKEGECVRQKLRLLVDELNAAKQSDLERAEALAKTKDELKLLETSTTERLQELQNTITSLEAKLAEVSAERDTAQAKYRELEEEREEEKKIVQEALDGALQERAELEAQWQLDFERLRTVNTGREQTLLEDFEWKLREVQRTCKQRVEEVEANAKIVSQEAQKKEQIAAQQLNEVIHLKSYEAEVAQLRGLTNEQQKSVLSLSNKLEELESQEEYLQSQITAAKEENVKLQRQLVDKDRENKVRIDEMKREVALQWESKMREEVSRLRQELEEVSAEERFKIINVLKAQHLQEIQNMQSTYNVLKDEATALREELTEAQTKCDRQAMEMSRAVDHTYYQHQDALESLKELQEKETDAIKKDYERRIEELETSWSLELSNARSAADHIRHELTEQSQQLAENHRRQLEQQWEQLVQEKEEALQAMELKHRTTVQTLQMNREVEVDDKLSDLSSTHEHFVEGLQRQHTEELARVTDRERETLMQLQQLQRKCACLTKLFEEMRNRYDRRDSREEDIRAIGDLKRIITEQEKDLTALTEDKRYLQLELAKRGDHIGEPRRKGGGRGKHIHNGSSSHHNGPHGSCEIVMSNGREFKVMDTVPEVSERQD